VDEEAEQKRSPNLLDFPAKVWRYLKRQVTSRLVKMGDHSYGFPVVDAWTPSDRCSIGKFCAIAPDVRIITGGEHRMDWVSTFPFRVRFRLPGAGRDGHPGSRGPVVLGNDVWIGQGARILSGVRVGNGAVVGAYAVVTKDVPDYAVVAGNPAQLIRYRFDPETIQALLKIAWWDWPLEKILRHVDLLCSDRIQEFIAAARGEDQKPKA